MNAPLTLNPEEEGALLLLLGSLAMNGADTGPVARPMIRLLWKLEQREVTRAVLEGVTVH